MNSKLADISREELAMYFEYLDRLRESGATNMFGARPYLAQEYSIPLEKAGRILSSWMGSDLATEPNERARKTLGESA